MTRFRLSLRSLAALYAVAFLARAAFLLQVLPGGPDSYMQVDSLEYVAIAEQLPEGIRTPRTIGEFRYNGLSRAPGYPLFLSPFVRAGAVPAALWLQVVLTSSIAPGVALLAAGFAPRRWALGAGAVSALSPTGVAAAATVMADGLFAAILLGSLLLLKRAVRLGCGKLTLAAAAGFAAACYVKPGGVFWAFACVPLVFAWSRAFGVAFSPKRLAVLVLTQFALIGLWSARNYAIEGTPMFSTNGGRTIVDYFGAKIEAKAAGVGEEGYKKIRAARRLERQSLPPHERIASERARIVQLVLDRPLTSIGVYAENALGATVVPWAAYSNQLGRPAPLETAIDRAFHWLLLAAAIAGAAATWKRGGLGTSRSWWALGLATGALYFVAVSGVTFLAGSRIFYPAEPLLSALATLVARPGESESAG